MPNLYLICGMSGSGKTTLAKKLESDKSAMRLCGDEFISIIIKDKNDRTELDRLRSPIEKIMWDLTRKLLAAGVNVILENVFWSQEERLQYLHSARQLNSSVKVILHYLDIPTETIWNRIQRRNIDLPNDCFHITREELDQWMSWFTPPDQDERKLYDDCEIHHA